MPTLSPSFIKAMRRFPELCCAAPLAAHRQQERTSMVLLWQPLQELVPPERGGTDAPETASHQGSFQQGPGHALALAPPKAQPLQVFKVG